jgi:hypothetical protein
VKHSLDLALSFGATELPIHRCLVARPIVLTEIEYKWPTTSLWLRMRAAYCHHRTVPGQGDKKNGILCANIQVGAPVHSTPCRNLKFNVKPRKVELCLNKYNVSLWNSMSLSSVVVQPDSPQHVA